MRQQPAGAQAEDGQKLGKRQVWQDQRGPVVVPDTAVSANRAPVAAAVLLYGGLLAIDGKVSIGTLIAFNQAYVHDSLAVRIVPLPQWLAVSPGSGLLAPGGVQTLTVAMDAAFGHANRSASKTVPTTRWRCATRWRFRS